MAPKKKKKKAAVKRKKRVIRRKNASHAKGALSRGRPDAEGNGKTDWGGARK